MNGVDSGSDSEHHLFCNRLLVRNVMIHPDKELRLKMRGMIEGDGPAYFCSAIVSSFIVAAALPVHGGSLAQ